jgi:hypothetical protein
MPCVSTARLTEGLAVGSDAAAAAAAYRAKPDLSLNAVGTDMPLLLTGLRHCKYFICNQMPHKILQESGPVSVDRLCGLAVRVPGCRPIGPRLDSQRYQTF